MAYSILNLYSILIQYKCKINHKKEIQYLHPRKTLQLPLILKIILNLALIGIVIIVLTHTEFQLNAGDSNVFLWFFIFYGGKVKLPAFFNTQKAQLPL
ncbi:hypothetical protein DQV74_14775 [Staphylococcus aureus]|nr:hypothetical protein DQV74_14775 [Staphylococcus aureus]QFL04775.1 hypothetical protein DQV75_14930 [Staphylococcus aureus]